MRRLGTSACAAIAAASLAFVAGAPAHAAGAPSFSSVPEARVPEMLHPKDAPDAIPAGERVEGVRVDGDMFKGAPTFTAVHADGGRCLSVGAIPPGVPPSGSAATSIRVGGVLPLRVERLVEGKPGEAELEIIDAWFDGRTSSVRPATTTRVPLTVLARGPASYEVYGFRKGSELQVVIPSRQQRIGYVDPRGQIGFAQCGHLRMGLDTTAKNGAMIVAAVHIRTTRAPSARSHAPSFHPAVMQQREGLAPDEVMRAVQISASTSRTKREREPLLSVSVGWVEDEEGVVGSNHPVNMDAPIAEPIIDDE
ncbi:hypothetical protein [Polyangium mundeleinium]|uniref:Uncharacterized protein n=1 Tax=Polyangium mundeleinium TaxID=2995306 RepID=A0ABT5EKJ3_9BACT|nr:hypothetical protein [Polyangium mundeleinium]MDC0742350.1 hypothetical protein [Polyangium mundeleinium]